MGLIASKLYGKYRRAFAMWGLVIRPTEYAAPSTSPSVSAGSGAPTESEPAGSLYLQTDGTPRWRAFSAWCAQSVRFAQAVATGTALTNSTTETVLASSSLPANTLRAGTRLRVKAVIRCSASGGATALTVKVRLGPTTLLGEVLINTGAGHDLSSGDAIIVTAEVVARAAPGASVSCVSHAQAVGTFAGLATPQTTAVPAFTRATNAALLVELTGQWAAADASSVAAEDWSVEVIG